MNLDLLGPHELVPASTPTTVEVPIEGWVAAVTAARDDLGLTYFDWLSAVDESSADGGAGLHVAVHLWSVQRREGLLLRTRVTDSVDSLVTVFRGASWHERETREMFGITFVGNPDTRPLLLPDGFAGHPLRKDFVLASRVAKAWPGAKEPGESDADLAAERTAPAARTRRLNLPPGVPDAGWPPGVPS